MIRALSRFPLLVATSAEATCEKQYGNNINVNNDNQYRVICSSHYMWRLELSTAYCVQVLVGNACWAATRDPKECDPPARDC